VRRDVPRPARGKEEGDRRMIVRPDESSDATLGRHRPLSWIAAGLALLAAAMLFVGLGCAKRVVKDAAMLAGKTPADFPEVTDDVFRGMDAGIELTADEIKGRNTWLLWTADNAEFWDHMAMNAYGTTDLLKMLDSRRRERRLAEIGVVNDPNCRAAAKPDENGLWLDEVVTPEPAGVLAAVYGKPSGVVGLRLFPNPNFTAQAKKDWRAESFYTDPDYYNDRKLIRPYRVGMACAFCHVAPNPMNPPADAEHPEWANLSSNIGNQYLRVSQVFGNGLSDSSFVYQMLDHIPRGALDTSFIATDHLNNPGSMNAVYCVADRVAVAKEEDLAGGALHYPGNKSRTLAPHVLKDGADSIGILGALNRVFVNIGLFNAEWLDDHNMIVGATPQHPFEIEKAQKNSVCWMATQNMMPNLAKFFLKVGQPMRLEEAPGGAALITKDQRVMDRGKVVFAEQCAYCHSGKQPPADIDRESERGREWYRHSVMAATFRDSNYLSTDERFPVSEIGTNATRALATNATRGHIWDNFSSETYKRLPAVGAIDYYDPFDSTWKKFDPPAGGPGYYRPPTLISVWASAPFFHNNSLGTYNPDPSVAARVKSYEEAMEKMLWPERRLNEASIWRRSRESWLEIPAPYLPKLLRGLAEDGFLRIGPVPAGTPINLLANADLELRRGEHDRQLFDVAKSVKLALFEIRAKHLNSAESKELLKRKVAPQLMKISKCLDWIEDRGHLYGTKIPDLDKRALIEFVKTL
jgi:hypothetical protein